MYGFFIALLNGGIAPLVDLRLLYALAYSRQCGLYFFFCSGYHCRLLLCQWRACYTSTGRLLQLLYTKQAFCGVKSVIC